VVLTAVLAVAVTCGLWWTYFRHAKSAFEHALVSRDGNARSRMARDVFSVIHFPMLCGIVAMAAAIEEALSHPDVPLAPDVRIALGAGAVLFVCGTALALWRSTGRLPPWRVVLVPVAAVAVIVTGAVPAVSMAILLATLVTISTIEHR
jgi:low temperature requirement protein LtrA